MFEEHLIITAPIITTGVMYIIDALYILIYEATVREPGNIEIYGD